MWSDQKLVRAIQTAAQDVVRDLRRRPLYRVVDEDEVLKNLFRRLEQNDRFEQTYQAGKSFTREITRQAHFAFFEQIHALLKNGPRQRRTFKELGQYFFQRALVSLYDLAPQYVGSDQNLARMEFKRLAFEASQAAIEHVYNRISRTGGIAKPFLFYSYASCTIRRQCLVILSNYVSSQVTIQALPGIITRSGLGTKELFDDSLSRIWMDIFQVAQQKDSPVVPKDATQVLANPNLRGIAILVLAGFNHGRIAALLNRSEQEIIANISELFEEWSNDASWKDRLRSNSERA